MEATIGLLRMNRSTLATIARHLRLTNGRRMRKVPHVLVYLLAAFLIRLLNKRDDKDPLIPVTKGRIQHLEK